MVYLNRIYTKTGDQGQTSLGDGTRVPKTNPRIEAFGVVDELNAIIGVVLTCADAESNLFQRLITVQNDLFDLGADLCVPESEEPPEYEPLRVANDQVKALENWIDQTTDHLQPLESFILPGGTPLAAHLHHARTVCRRAEIQIYRLIDASTNSINEHIPVYLNRLSDLLFVLARQANNGGQNDILWKPGGERLDK